MTDEHTLLQVGAILPLAAQSGSEADTLLVQTFGHPALAGQRFVRLVVREHERAAQIEMGVRGFDAAQPATALGYHKKRTLGFPAWAFVHHPDKTQFTLALMRDFRKAAALAQSRPGGARTAFAKIGQELERKVPAFLPLFWEEAGRRFIEADNPKMAAPFFGKAREAERVYGLPIDDLRHTQAYLEFAHAGAVNDKDLVNLPKDLSGLAQREGRDPLEVQLSFVEAMLRGPTLQNAPNEFWTRFFPALQAYAQQSVAHRARVITLLPTPKHGRDGKFAHAWLGLLEKIGAIEHWLAEDTPEHVEQSARWLEALAFFIGDPMMREPPPRREITGVPAFYRRALEQLAPRIRAQGRALHLYVQIMARSREYNYSIDLLEFALRQGLSLRAPEAHTYWGYCIDLSAGYDPQHLYAHPDYKRPLHLAVISGLLNGSTFAGLVKDHPTYRKICHSYLSKLLDSIEGAPEITEAVRVVSAWSMSVVQRTIDEPVSAGVARALLRHGTSAEMLQSLPDLGARARALGLL